MAGGRSSKERKQQKRVGPSVNATVAQSASRVSKAAGSLSSSSMHVDQNGTGSSRKGSGRGGIASASAPKQGRRGQGQGRQGSKSAKGKSNGPGHSSPAAAPTPRTSDTRFIDWLRGAWSGLEPHHQQRLFGFMLLVLSLLLLAILTVFRSVTVLSAIAGFFNSFFGWSSDLLALGLIAFSIAHLAESIRNQRFIRWSLVIGLIVLWLIVLAESHLLIGGETGGAVASLLVMPLAHWSAPMKQVLLIGLFIIVCVVTFRITFGHVLLISRVLGRVIRGGQKVPSSGRTGGSGGPSPYLGQRPQYSRYSANGGTSAPASSGHAGQAPLIEDEDDVYSDDGEALISFESDFDEDDPDNDINLHRNEVGMVPRGSRPAPPLNREEHNAAVQGAHQPALPFNAPPSAPVLVNKRSAKAGNGPKNKPDTMEPLVPNPLLAKQQNANALINSPWVLPDTSILNNPDEVKHLMLGDDTSMLAKIIQDTLRSFRVDAEVRPEDISIGPTIIRFGIRPTGKPEMKQDAQGRSIPVRDASGNMVYESRTRVSRIMALQNDLALVLEAKSIRMEAPVPGRPYVGVEIPNKNSRLVTLREVLESKEYLAARAKSRLAMALGKDVAGAVRVGDLARMPHLLIAGATGAGKSVCINTIIASIVTQATPDDVRMLMVDPKMVELSMYNGIPHLLSPVVTEVEKVVPLLKNAINEMEQRYRLFSQLGVRNLDGYRKLRNERAAKGDSSLKNLPAIVIIIDELADLMMVAPEEVEGMICRLAQLARATGIHLVIATQRPSVDVITGLIKANIPTRISFMVSSAVDSRTIIDMGGAERLLGRGDMLYLPADAGRPERIQGAFLADEEAERLVSYWHEQAQKHAGGQNIVAQPPVEPGWEIQEHVSDDFELEDDLLEKAEEVVREYGRASISLLQRRLRIGYSRAARLIDLLEEQGIIGRSESGGRSREVYDSGNGNGNGNGSMGGGRTMADEVADIIAEEKAQEDFLKKQAASGRAPQSKGYSFSVDKGDDEDEDDEGPV